MKQLLILLITILTVPAFAQQVQKQNPLEFIPKGYVLFEKIQGDLDKDGVDDCVLIIKGTDKSKIVKEENKEALDRNRRGIIILFNKKSWYELAVKNYECFASENEDGGVYYAPELYVEIKNRKLYLRYAHGRYGNWQFTFRFQHADFELIGYDESSNRGPIVNGTASINFLTGKKQVKQNVNEKPELESGEEVFKETNTDIKTDKLVKLSEVRDFDELDMSVY